MIQLTYGAPAGAKYELGGTNIMKIEVSTTDDICILFPEGWVDSTNASELEQSVNAYVDDYDTLVLDLAGVDYISSAGLRVIVSTHKEMAEKGGDLILRNLNRNVSDIIRLTGFDKKLNIEKD